MRGLSWVWGCGGVFLLSLPGPIQFVGAWMVALAIGLSYSAGKAARHG